MFKSLVASDGNCNDPRYFQDLALTWCKETAGKPGVFPTLPVYLRRHHKAWLRNYRVQQHVKKMQTQLRQLDASNRKSMQKMLTGVHAHPSPFAVRAYRRLTNPNTSSGSAAPRRATHDGATSNTRPVASRSFGTTGSVAAGIDVMVTVTVPPTASPGHLCAFSAQGARFQIRLPLGCTPGEALRVRIPGNSSANNSAPRRRSGQRSTDKRRRRRRRCLKCVKHGESEDMAESCAGNRNQAFCVNSKLEARDSSL